jgi:hypothetical protein
MITERQANVLIEGHDTLVASVARTLDTEDTDSREQAEKVISTVADWLTRYRPVEFGDEYCSPLDVTAFILRKGELADR